MSSTPVLLVSAPFGPLRSPSLGLSLLQASLEAKGIGARIHYLTLDFAKMVGQELYIQLTEEVLPSVDLLGEWIFAEALNEKPGDVEGYLREVWEGASPAHRKIPGRLPKDPEAFLARVLDARAKAGPFLDAWAERLVEAGPRVVGFTSVFQQNAASLALAARIKRLRPEVLTVLGGSNAEGAMGQALSECFPALDLVVSGEAETRFPEAVSWILEGKGVPAFGGFSLRPWLAALEPAQEPPAPRLDGLPVPDYGDYFAALEASGLDLQVHVPFETSRGCWWGERHHCTFCGLNGQGMAFRSKPADQALEELRHLRKRHPGREVAVVDNILDMAYFRTFLPALAAERNPSPLFFEVKANLKKDQLRLLKDAGVLRLQPGIESLSDAILNLMGKGVKALHCIQLLKWCQELGIRVGWNILAGFPGEDPAEYRRMAELVPALAHLPPPQVCGTLILERFSPNFDEAGPRGFEDVHAYPSYAHVYGLPQEALDRLAYAFTFRYADGRDVAAYLEPLRRAVDEWQSRPATLMALDQGRSILVFDSRPCSEAPMYFLEGTDAWVLRVADAATSLDRLKERAQREGFGGLEAALERLQALHLVLVEGGACLGLVPGLSESAPALALQEVPA